MITSERLAELQRELESVQAATRLGIPGLSVEQQAFVELLTELITEIEQQNSELDQWREVGRLLAEIFNYDFGPDVDEKFMPQVIALLAKGEQ